MSRAEQPMRKVLTVDEAADYLRVHRSTIYRLLKARAIPAFKIGSDWRFSVVALDQWVRDGGVMKSRPGW